MRKLSDKFMNDLKNDGAILKPLMNFILEDNSLEFMIRDEYVNIYYRGGSLLKIEPSGDTYKFTFDGHYYQKQSKNFLKYRTTIKELSARSIDNETLDNWIEIIPFLKQSIDIYRTKEKSNLEREYQQLVAKECNELNKSISNGSEIFIVDIEYAIENHRFDLIGIEWDRRKASLKGNYKPKLLLIEMKFGDNAIDGKNSNLKSADIKQHISDVEDFANGENLKRLKKEILTILNQKRELGFFRGIRHNKNKVSDLDIDKPDFILLLAAHNPRSKILLRVLNDLPHMKSTNLKLSVANFMGYGLYSECIYSLDEFKYKFKNQIYCEKMS